MTLFHYIGSPVELPLGERGSRSSFKTYSELLNDPVFQAKREKARMQGTIPLEDIIDLSHLKDEEVQVFDTEEDAAGIYIEELGSWNREICKHFHSEYMYRISPSWGGFRVLSAHLETREESENASLKCCRELFKLMRDFGPAGAEFELYSCWADEESYPRKKAQDRIIELSSFSLEAGFDMEDKEYILVKLGT